MRPSSYCISVNLCDRDSSLLFHGYSGAVDRVQRHVVDFLKDPERETNGNNGAVSEKTLSLLQKRGYLTCKSVEEEKAFVRELGERVHRFSRKHAPAGFLFVPTYSCNLRCPYCYEKNLRKRGPEWFGRVMDRDTADAAFAAMAALDTLPRKRKSLSFYGGEPFQEKTRDAVAYIFEKAREKGFTLFSAITNGVDLNHFLDLLGPDGKVNFLQITVDGPPEIHNKRRFLADGSPTFDRICGNIDKALETGVTISVRINVDRKNADGIARLKAYFASRGWDQRENFRAYCSPVHGSIDDCKGDVPTHFKGHMDMQRSIPFDESVRDATVEVRSITKSVSRSLLSHMRLKGLPRWKTGFCGSNLAMHLLDPHGDIYPCWETVGHLEHRIGRYGTGYVEIYKQEAEKWHDRSVVRIQGCRSCRYLFFCGGGCEAFALQKTGRLDRPNCNDFPEVFEKAARIAYEDFLEAGKSDDTCGECRKEG